MESVESKPPISTILTNDSILESVKIEAHNSKPIVITKCLSQQCSRFYTDSISESILVRCLDPKHKVDEVGHQPTPGAEDVTQKTTATQPAKLGSVIKWNIQQS